MGGYGSGSRSRWASKTDEFHKLDLATFEREWFERHRSGTVTWSRGGRQTGSIGYRLSPESMGLHYSVSTRDGPRNIDERFSLSFTEQPFGGRRMWIVCPSCSNRCRVLYGATYFRCRTCYRATYPSQYETIRVAGLSVAERVRDRLGGEPGLLNLFPRKPKGMHWQTYRRLEQLDCLAVKQLEDAMYVRLAVYN